MRKREARENIRQILVNNLRRKRKDYVSLFGTVKEQEEKVLKEAMLWWADKLDKSK